MPSFELVLMVAFGLVLVLEGIGPFAFPKQWQRMLQSLSQMPESSLRLMGLVMMVVGVVVIVWLKP